MPLLFVIVLIGCLFNPPVSEGFSTAVGGETITWDFQGIPAWNFMVPASPCYFQSSNNWHICEYGMMDVPYLYPITFSASMQPSKGTYPGFWFGYYHFDDISNFYPFTISSSGSFFPAPLNLSTSFFIPAKAGEFELNYWSDGSGVDPNATKIAFNWKITNYDPVRANMFGGEDINPDTEYCDEKAQPGKPKIRKFKNNKGAGPGK